VKKNIRKYIMWPAILVFFHFALLTGQEGMPGLNYQGTVISNPSVTGSSGKGMLQISYQNLYPGNSYNFHSVCFSYDSYFQSLHGGAGIYISDNYLGGIINDLKGGFSYSYMIRAGSDLYFSAGLSASFYHRGFNFSGAVLPDMIDPLEGSVYPSGESLASRGKTVFDVGTGFLFITGRIFGGLAINHLTEPDLGTASTVRNRIPRSLLIHGSGEVEISSAKRISLQPVGKIEISRELISEAGGIVLRSRYISINSVLLADNRRDIDLQAGFSINAGSFIVFYNYRFNIASGVNLMPVSLLHYTGIAFSLNNVDKRKIVRTINFPEL
jgi:type IX secretion system PorP/SprF family membrane protein